MDLGKSNILHIPSKLRFAIFNIYSVWITSVLSMSIYYYSTISELQCFVMQPFVLPVLRAVNLHVLILKIEHIQNVGFSQIRSQMPIGIMDCKELKESICWQHYMGSLPSLPTSQSIYLKATNVCEYFFWRFLRQKGKTLN